MWQGRCRTTQGSGTLCIQLRSRAVSAVTEGNATASDPEVLTPVDLVVLGSGVGGLTAALAAALEGLRAVVLEHSDRIGGTSARSSGTVWVPGNHYLRTHGVT